MKMTVAVACYNQEDKIEKCLESVIRQDYENLEVLIVDDHSTDNSLGVITHFSDSHPEKDIRIISHERNMGINQSRNTAIDASKGEYIFFIDGDDTIEPFAISVLYNKTKEADVDFVGSSFRAMDLDGRVMKVYHYPEDVMEGDFALARYIEKHVRGFAPIHMTTKLYKMEFLKKNNIRCNPDLTHCDEAGVFSLQIAWRAKNIAFVNEITYNWIQHPQSISHQKHPNKNQFVLAQKGLESTLDLYARLKQNSKNVLIPDGMIYLLCYIVLTDGKLRQALYAEVTVKEKKDLLRSLKNKYAENDIKLCNILGIYNKLSYLILVSPFPYSLFHFYFRHLKKVVWIVSHTKAFKINL